MGKSGMRIVKRPRTPEQQIQVMKSEVRKSLQPLVDQHVARRAAIVSGWHHQPKFKSIIRAGPQSISVRVVIENARQSLGKHGGTIADLWDWHNRGTRPHPIAPRFASALRWVAGAATVFTRLVKKHPGMRGRKHDQTINRQLQPLESVSFRKGVDSGFRKLGR